MAVILSGIWLTFDKQLMFIGKNFMKTEARNKFKEFRKISV